MTVPALHTRWVLAALRVALVVSPLASQAQSASRGQTLFESRCTACHGLDANRVGPALGTVLGRRAGSAPGFDYSPALAGATHRWSRQLLLAWLTNPEDVVPGQRMGYRVEQALDREDLVAYLSAASPGQGHAK